MFIAVDTNVLLDLACDEPNVQDAIEVIRRRLNRAAFLVPPTVLQELASRLSKSPDQSEPAFRALSCLREWDFKPINLIPAGHGIVEQIAMRLRSKGVIPDEEVNDSLILAESALLRCEILLSSDGELRDAQKHPLFKKVLEDSHVDLVIIAAPAVIVKNYGLA